MLQVCRVIYQVLNFNFVEQLAGKDSNNLFVGESLSGSVRIKGLGFLCQYV